MRGQPGFWDVDERYVRLSEAGDPLEKLDTRKYPRISPPPSDRVF